MPAETQFSLDSIDAYANWRARKLAHFPAAPEAIAVAIRSLGAPTLPERNALIAACARANMAFYRVERIEDPAATRLALLSLARALSLSAREDHRSAAGDGIVSIERAQDEARRNYIPYSARALSWHTDGYYNYHGPDNCVQGMLLHCVREAASGGENAFLDPDIAYIRLRDANPDFVAALMHPQAMTIPPGEGAGRKPRPANAGPVFAVDPRNGGLIMRFTERKRHVVWREDETTRAAVEALRDILASEPLILRLRLAPGEGVICNNVLHARTAFDEASESPGGRLLYRVRYRERLTGEEN